MGYIASPGAVLDLWRHDLWASVPINSAPSRAAVATLGTGRGHPLTCRAPSTLPLLGGVA